MPSVAGGHARQNGAREAVWRRVWKLLVWGLAIGIVWAPQAAFAQPASFDPSTQATAQRAASQTGALVRPGAVDAAVSVPDIGPDTGDAEIETDDGAFTDGDADSAAGSEDGADESDSGVQTARPRQPGSQDPGSQDEEAEPSSDFPDRASYTSDGVTIEAPAGWIVEEASGFNTLFEIQAPDAELFVLVEGASGGSALDFPGLFALGILGSGDLLLTELGEGSELVDSRTGFTSQGIPYRSFELTGEVEGIQAGVQFYVLSPGKEAFMIIAFAPIAQWPELRPGVELIADSMHFAPERITLEQAPDDAPMAYSTMDETISLSLPAGWYLTETDDPDLPLILADADINYTAALVTEPLLAAEWETELLELLLPEEGEVEAEIMNELVDILLDTLDADQESMQLDPDQREIFSRADAVTVRFVGTGNFEDDLVVDLVGYLELRPAGGVILLLFGDAGVGLADEPILLELIESVSFAPAD